MTNPQASLPEPRFTLERVASEARSLVMGRIPIHVITTRAALLGAAAYGLESLKKHQG